MKAIKHVSVALIIFVLKSQSALGGTLLHNINGYTPTEDGLRHFSSLVFDDNGRVVAVGDDSLAEEYPATTIVDGKRRTVLPGLIDAHAHVYALGELQANVNLLGSESVEAAVALIADYAASRPASRWIRGAGWNQVIWPGQEFPTAGHIDAVISDRPVMLERIDGHAAWLNSLALQLAGIDDETPDPPGGKIVRDNRGKATGILVDKAMNLATSKIPPPGDADIANAIRLAISTVAAEGITSVHDAGISLQIAEVYLSMAQDRQLDIRIYAMISGATAALDAIGKPVPPSADDRLEISAVKLVADGALGSRGAALLEPYSDDPENRGLPFWTQAELDQKVAKANAMGFQVAVHAIGDRGNQLALNAIAAAQGGKPSAFRNRIEHAQVLALQDIPRFEKLGVIASVQATHATSDKNMAEDRLGPDRIQGAYAWRRLLDSGAVVANGSDFPVELSNPFHGLYAAVTRKDRLGEPDGGWYADQALSREEALRTFTLSAATAAHQEDRLGSLESGKWADFIVVDRDYFTIPADQIDDIHVLETWVAGKKIFDREKNSDR